MRFLDALRPGRRCPCCGARAARFLPGGPSRRPDAKCPTCGSLERHRLLWLALDERVGKDLGIVVHVAPEPVLERRLRKAAAHYVSLDLSGRADVRMDVTRLALPSATVDLVVANHVLEHVPDDRAALTEVHRILAPGGLAILNVPLDPTRATTDEDPSVTDPAERVRRFGQDDHVRLYGRDFADRVRAAGLDYEEWGGQIGRRRRRRWGLGDEVAFLAAKPG